MIVVIVLILIVYGIAMTVLFAEARSDYEEEKGYRLDEKSYYENVIDKMQEGLESRQKMYDGAAEEYKDQISRLEESYKRFTEAISIAVERELELRMELDK